MGYHNGRSGRLTQFMTVFLANDVTFTSVFKEINQTSQIAVSKQRPPKLLRVRRRNG
jgi:hypothetical protein